MTADSQFFDELRVPDRHEFYADGSEATFSECSGLSEAIQIEETHLKKILSPDSIQPVGDD